jgi:hypothetical protein
MPVLQSTFALHYTTAVQMEAPVHEIMDIHSYKSYPRIEQSF